MNIPPYPLAWPENQNRSTSRVKSAFRTNLQSAMKNVADSLRLFAQDSGRKMDHAQITANVGLMNMSNPADPGIAVWFMWDGALRCIAVDRYQTVAENLQALHHVLEARRVELRHAGIEMVRTTFRGFIAALPAPDAKKPWHVVLGVATNATADQVKDAYRSLARKHNGNDSIMAEINAAKDQADGRTP